MYTISSPAYFLVQDAALKEIHNTPKTQESKTRVLETYYNDVYKLFLKKLSDFDVSCASKPEEKEKLTELLNELITVKNILCEK